MSSGGNRLPCRIIDFAFRNGRGSIELEIASNRRILSELLCPWLDFQISTRLVLGSPLPAWLCFPFSAGFRTGGSWALVNEGEVTFFAGGAVEEWT